MRFQPKDSISIYVAVAILLALVFLADVYTALGIAVWIFYLAPLVITLSSWRPMVPLAVTVVISGLAIAGFLLSPPGADPTIALINRGLCLGTVAVVAGVIRHFILGRLAVRRDEWLQVGQTGLNARMGGEQPLDQLGENILRYLADYLGAQAGAIYLFEDGQYLLAAGHAIPAAAALPQTLQPGEGLLGQCIKDNRIYAVSNLPDDYVRLGSALGSAAPRHLLLAAAAADGKVQAGIELSFLAPVDEAMIELLNRTAGAMAVSVRSAQYRVQLEILLEETQRQAEELQAQGEELRVSNEELEQQSRVLQESQVRLEQQQVELEQSNSQLEEQAQALEIQKNDLVEAKNALETQTRELAEASRYKSEFLASMSHELRTPLNSSLILARLLVENRHGNLTAEQVEYARSIEASGNSLLDLINDVLDLAKVEAGRMEVRAQYLPVTKVVESLRLMFDPIARQKQLNLEFSVAPGTPAAMETDGIRLEQVLKNLLSNALKFTERGTVALTAAPAGEGRITFTVRDTGIGIASHLLEEIFEPFRQGESTLSRKYGGTGLGLSISRELVRLLGGEISVRSTPGEGSEFTIEIPARLPRDGRPAPAPEPMAAPMRRPAAPPARPAAAPARLEDDRQLASPGERTILVVEDDEVFAYILRDLSRELNFRCLIATTAAEAMVLAAQYQPSAMVLDVSLPDQSGLTLLDRLKLDERTRHIPVHVVSAHDYAETALALGAVGYILKPVKREQLVGAFERLEERLAQRLRRVLIVEDDALQLQSLTALLGSRDIDIVGASTAAECLDQLRMTSFDCMVLDLSLPDASGFTLLETISHEDRYSFPPVIVYTGRELTAEEEQRLRRFSKSIIIKGAKSPERLLDEVTLFLHQVVAELPAEHRKMIAKARSRDAILEGRNILLVEDDVRNIFALTSLLEPRGVRLQVARNGREALDFLGRCESGEAGPVDLVLMDIMMPEMDGITAMREIRKRTAWSRLPIIALTAKAMKNDQDQVIAAGANDYMAKPIDSEQFLSVVRVWMPR